MSSPTVDDHGYIGPHQNPTARHFERNEPVEGVVPKGDNDRVLNREGRAICRIVHAHGWSILAISKIFKVGRAAVTKAVKNSYYHADDILKDYNHVGPDYKEKFPRIQAGGHDILSDGSESEKLVQRSLPPPPSTISSVAKRKRSEGSDEPEQAAKKGRPMLSVLRDDKGEERTRASETSQAEIPIHASQADSRSVCEGLRTILVRPRKPSGSGEKLTASGDSPAETPSGEKAPSWEMLSVLRDSEEHARTSKSFQSETSIRTLQVVPAVRPGLRPIVVRRSKPSISEVKATASEDPPSTMRPAEKAPGSKTLGGFLQNVMGVDLSRHVPLFTARGFRDVAILHTFARLDEKIMCDTLRRLLTTKMEELPGIEPPTDSELAILEDAIRGLAG
ncbi:hypothetical protein B0H19DRAFT_1088608, partial [Mycena capillaripes]